MFNSFPQPKPDAAGGNNLLDWSAYTPVYDLTGATTSVAASTWNTFVDIIGKGFLKWCRADSVTAGFYNPTIKLTVDGLSYQFETSTTGNGAQGNEVSFEIPFKTSLKIEVLNSSGSIASISCDYLYLLQQTGQNPSKITLLLQSSRKMAYLTGNSTVLTDILNVTGSGYLLGVRFHGFYNTGITQVQGDIAVDGIQKMTDRVLLYTGGSQNKQSEVVGPIRFNSSLRIKTRVTAAAGSYACMAWYSLD